MWRWRTHPTASPASDLELSGRRMRQHRGSGAERDTEGSDHKGHNEHLRHDHQHRESSSRRRAGFLGVRKRNTVWFALAGLMVFPVLMALVDVMKARRINGELHWDKLYMRAVVENQQQWHLGWRLEDLARQIMSQRARMMILLDTLKSIPAATGNGLDGVPFLPDAAKAFVRGQSSGTERGGKGGGGDGEGEGEGGGLSKAVIFSKVFAEEEDLNRIVSVECASRPGAYVQVGMHSMVASAEASCKVYSASTTLDPHALFEKIELGGGRFALRAFSNRRFLRVVPPVITDLYSDWTVWTLEVGAPEVGLPEVFRMRDGMVYSEAMHGYLSCSGGGAEAEVKGFVGEYLWQDQLWYQLIFNQVSAEDIERARTLRDVSRAVNAEQQRQTTEYIAAQAALDDNGDKEDVHRPQTIAICVPMTSRGTVMGSTYDSPVWTHAFSTFLSTIDWHSPRFRFHWYFGFDAGDPIYDEPGAAEHLKKQFTMQALKEFRDQGLSEGHSRRLMYDNAVRLSTSYFEDMQHAPSYVVSALVQEAYDDGCDYFYQINDDTLINTPGWADFFTGALRRNPLGRNVGVTGPADTNNRRILTHAFVHRTHIDVFGRFFPDSFKNWWSDDWISNVYGRDHTLRDHAVTITHDVRSQKADAPNRYDVDQSAQHSLRKELQKGHVKLSKWLKANGLPPPLLPVVCGYSPLASGILKILQDGWTGDDTLRPPPSAAAEPVITGGGDGG